VQFLFKQLIFPNTHSLSLPSHLWSCPPTPSSFPLSTHVPLCPPHGPTDERASTCTGSLPLSLSLHLSLSLSFSLSFSLSLSLCARVCVCVIVLTLLLSEDVQRGTDMDKNRHPTGNEGPMDTTNPPYRLDVGRHSAPHRIGEITGTWKPNSLTCASSLTVYCQSSTVKFCSMEDHMLH
jgi:hypothetical protein